MLYLISGLRGYIDATDPSTARYSNGVAGDVTPNVVAVEDKKRVFLVAAKDISLDEEILWDSDDDFPWKLGQLGVPSGELRKPPPLLQALGDMVIKAIRDETEVKSAADVPDERTPAESPPAVQPTDDKYVANRAPDDNDPPGMNPTSLKVGDYVYACGQKYAGVLCTSGHLDGLPSWGVRRNPYPWLLQAT